MSETEVGRKDKALFSSLLRPHYVYYDESEITKK
jgi:hypothetical protein